MSESSPKAPSFEKAFERLEAILEKMNSGAISLDESLKLFEEADQLIHSCQTRLSDAERKVQSLIKNRAGEVTTGPDGAPQTETFDS